MRNEPLVTGTEKSSENLKRLLNSQTSIHLYVGFLTQTSQPAFLLGLRFFRDQFFLDLVADFGEGAGDAAAFIFDFKNVIFAGVLDDDADVSSFTIKRDILHCGCVRHT